MGAIAAAAALSYVKWPVLWLHRRRRARRPGATGPYSKKAHPRHHNSLSPIPWKQQANKKTTIYLYIQQEVQPSPAHRNMIVINKYEKLCLIVTIFPYRDKISKPSRKNKNYRKAKKPKGESLTKNAKARLQPELGENQVRL